MTIPAVGPVQLDLHGISFELLPGRLGKTVDAILAFDSSRYSNKEVRTALGEYGGSSRLNRYYLAALVQVKWYETFEQSVPQKILDTLERMKMEALAEKVEDKPLSPALVAHQFKPGQASPRAEKWGPTAMAKKMLADGKTDEEILTATNAEFGPGSKHPLKFVKGDLKRLRARMQGV